MTRCDSNKKTAGNSSDYINFVRLRSDHMEVLVSWSLMRKHWIVINLGKFDIGMYLVERVVDIY